MQDYMKMSRNDCDELCILTHVNKCTNLFEPEISRRRFIKDFLFKTVVKYESSSQFYCMLGI